MEREKVGARIYGYRRSRGISQHALALKSGVSPTYIHQLERGIKSPTVEYLGYICDALGITLADFFAIERTEHSKLAALTDKQRDCLNAFLVSLEN